MILVALTLFVPAQPIAGRPTNYIGAVGSFRLESSVEPTSGDASTVFILMLKLTGKGDVGSASIPDLSKQKSFDAKFVIAGPPSRQPIRDGVEFRYSIRIRSTEVDAVPAISLAVWNPSAPRPRYETLASQKTPIAVRPAAKIEASEFVRQTEAVPSESANDAVWLLLIPLAAVVAVVGVFLLQRVSGRPRRPSTSVVDSPAAASVPAMEDARDVLVRILGLTPGSRTTTDILQAAEVAEIDSPTLESLRELLISQDWIRFRGDGASNEDIEARLRELADRCCRFAGN